MTEERKKPKRFLTEIAIDAAGKALPIIEEAVKDLLKYSKETAAEKLVQAKEKMKDKKNESIK